MKTPAPRSITSGPVWRSRVRLVKGCSRLAMSRLCILLRVMASLSRAAAIYLRMGAIRHTDLRISPMPFQRLAARLALGALNIAVLVADVAIAGVRLDKFSYAAGMTLMWPATALGLVALVLALLWAQSAI